MQRVPKKKKKIQQRTLKNGLKCRPLVFMGQSTAAALAGWRGGLECRPVQQKVVGSTLGQGTSLGCGFNPQAGHVWEAMDRYFSLTSKFLSPRQHPLPLSLKSINMSSGED